MREILFRGKREVDGYWVEGYYVKAEDVFGDESYSIIFRTDVLTDLTINNFDGYRVVRPETVGQFTGRLDKNGKKIFEGDIVKTKYGRLCIVVWYSSRAHTGWDLEIVNTIENCLHTMPPDDFDLYGKENLEVIGNVHDNPELLEKMDGRIPSCYADISNYDAKPDTTVVGGETGRRFWKMICNLFPEEV